MPLSLQVSISEATIAQRIARHQLPHRSVLSPRKDQAPPDLRYFKETRNDRNPEIGRCG
jgi:hypothetical protein